MIVHFHFTYGDKYVHFRLQDQVAALANTLDSRIVMCHITNRGTYFITIQSWCFHLRASIRKANLES